MWGQDDSQLMQKVSANAKKNTRSDLDLLSLLFLSTFAVRN